MITGFDELHGEVELHDRGQKGSELRQPVTSRFHVQVVVGVFVHNCSRQTVGTLHDRHTYNFYTAHPKYFPS